MKKYSFLLLIPVLLTGCSQNEEITPESVPPVVETQKPPVTTPPSDSSTTDVSQDPPESSIQTLSAETIHYLSECALLLDEFDVIYRRMEEAYSYAPSQDSDSHLENYLAEISNLIHLLEQPQDLEPTEEVESQHQYFATASLALAEHYKTVDQRLEERQGSTEEQWLLLESTFPDLLPILEDFSNSAFVLMVGLGQDNLAG